MATFPSIKPIYGQQKRSAPLTRTVRFADGYEHRILFGLAQHQNPKVFQLTFNVSETESDEIETFLDARANDSDSFTFSCWVYPKSIPLEDGDSYGIVQRPGFHTGIEYMNDEGNGAFRVGCWDMDDNYYFVKSRRVTFQWYNVCCVVDKNPCSSPAAL